MSFAESQVAAGESGPAAATRPTALPSVTVIMPVRNEERYIARTLQTVLEQDYPPDRMEVLVAEGMSTDRTRGIIQGYEKTHPNVRLIENPGKIVSTGLNSAIALAHGEIVVRMDGHCEYPRDYVRRVVELLERTGADNAGGVLAPTGTTYVQQAICAAYYSPVGVGRGAQRGREARDDIRTAGAVHGGCWRRDRLLSIGLFDEEMVRNQDDELSYRLRKFSGRIVRSSAIRIQYAVRSSFRRLFSQFAQYGYWKVRVVAKHPRQSSARHFLPALFVGTVIISGLAAPFSRASAAIGAGLLLLYLLVIMLAAAASAARRGLRLWPGIVAAFASMHIGYGLGFLLGCFRYVPKLKRLDLFFASMTR